LGTKGEGPSGVNCQIVPLGTNDEESVKIRRFDLMKIRLFGVGREVVQGKRFDHWKTQLCSLLEKALGSKKRDRKVEDICPTKVHTSEDYIARLWSTP
jgi:hypothetical protein